MIFRERGKEEGRGRKISIGCLSYAPWPDIELAAFCFEGWCPTHWATWVLLNLCWQAFSVKGRETFQALRAERQDWVIATALWLTVCQRQWEAERACIWSLSRLLSSALGVRKQPQRTPNWQEWLCSNKTLFIGTEICISFHVPWTPVLLLLVFNHLKMSTPFLAYGLYVVCHSLFESWLFIIQQSLIEWLWWAGGEVMKDTEKKLAF